jgi:hypothetical protein
MDKYEFNIKVEQIRKLVNKGDYGTAMKIADTIDWKKVHNANLLSMVAQVYEKNEEYQDAKDILLLAFERAPIGKRLLYKLTELALKEGNVEEAEGYYREFCDLAGDDPRQQLLRYQILKQKQAPLAQLISSLENYTSEELDEKWLYELAELYHKAGDSARCVAACDKIMLMFGLGKYVDKAMDLKIQYSPLTQYQMDLVENRDKYEARLRAVEQDYQGGSRNEKDRRPAAAPPVSRPAQAIRQPEPEAAYPAAGVYGTGQAEAVRERTVLPETVQPEAAQVQVRTVEPETAQVQERTALPETAQTASAFPGTGHPELEAAYGVAGFQDADEEEMAYEADRFQDAGQEEAVYQAAGTCGAVPAEPPYTAAGTCGAVPAEPPYTAAEACETAPAAAPAYRAQEDLYGAPGGNVPAMHTVYGQGSLENAVKQAETQATLAREMSRLAEQGVEDPAPAADDMGKTRVLTAIRRTVQENPVPEPAEAPGTRQIPAQPEAAGRQTTDYPAPAASGLVEGPVPQGQTSGTAAFPGNASGQGAFQDTVAGGAAVPAPASAPSQAGVTQAPETPAPAPGVRNIGDYVIIEARMPERGLAMATAILKQIRKETGIRNPVAKITGSRLNRIGVQASAQKLAGKDLMIEEAGDLEPGRVQELEDMMTRNQYGMRVILLDNPKQLQMFCNRHLSFAERFDYIGCEDYQSGEEAQESAQAEPAVMPGTGQNRTSGEGVSGGVLDASRTGTATGAGSAADSARTGRTADPAVSGVSPDAARTGGTAASAPQEPDDRPVRHIVPVRDGAMRAPDMMSYGEPPADEGISDEYQEEMDIDEFAQYACKYASEIDCSITGKSMLALYERIEIMEEDSIPLTRENAEALIEEAADRAEKPSLGRRIRGLFSSKYDKQGMLILKEEHFI